ncbi:hypothetical protein B5G26_04340 [Anaerotignum lactatifermentans]|uniref:Uncharacterized protein n=1 Tax=Anaerotignum lactatifermentans TaxID=160404 RepID=A0A1Y3U7Z5_9FIRM|nr:hypothetical protein [Anaerotignum lactatifermentans]OUN44874.1 hypothetical protein B5G26_04340 [Anaerotignum lactatifermentans]
MKPITKIIPILLLLSFSAAGCGEKEQVEETQKKVSYEELTQDPQLSDALEEMDDESREKLENSEEIVVTQGVLTKEETEK